MLAGAFISLIPSVVMAGNVKKLYVNVAKEGNQAQASDIPANYGTIENGMKNVAYNYALLPLHGQIYGTTSQGENGKLFNGTSDYISLGNQTPFNITDQLTITAKVFLQSANGTVVDKGGEPETFSMGVRGGKPFFYREEQNGTNRYLGGNTVLDLNKWYTLTVVDDGTTMKIFVDGKQESYTISSVGWNAGIDASPVTIGKIGASGSEAANTGWFKGNVKEVTLWNQALSNEMITKHVNQPFQGTEPGLVGVWVFN